jgi:hypothetical protein
MALASNGLSVLQAGTTTESCAFFIAPYKNSAKIWPRTGMVATFAPCFHEAGSEKTPAPSFRQACELFLNHEGAGRDRRLNSQKLSGIYF